jgi:hypothetical protein
MGEVGDGRGELFRVGILVKKVGKLFVNGIRE